MFSYVVQQALLQSQDPHFVDHLLEVLTRDGMGKEIHAAQIRKVYQKKKAEHRPCGKYREGMTEYTMIKLCQVKPGLDMCNLYNHEKYI